MAYEEQVDLFAELKRAHEEYRVYDTHYESIGKADELFVDEADRPLYIGIKTGFLEARTALVPLEIVRVNDKRRVIEIAGDADQVRHAPSLGGREEITADLEARIHSYFGLPGPPKSEREHHDLSSELVPDAGFAPDERIDVEPGERQEAHERFGETPPPHTRRDAGIPDYLPGATHESPSRGVGKGWARGTERIPPDSEAGSAPRDPRAARARRLKR
jgi:hypothetical protein